MCGTDGKKVGGELNAIGLMNTVVSLFPPPLRVPVMLMLHVTEREEAELSGKKWEMGGGGGHFSGPGGSSLLFSCVCSAAPSLLQEAYIKGEEEERGKNVGGDGRADGKGVRREGRSLHHLIHGLPSSPPLASQIQFLSFAPPSFSFQERQEGGELACPTVSPSLLPSPVLPPPTLSTRRYCVGGWCTSSVGRSKKKARSQRTRFLALKRRQRSFLFPLLRLPSCAGKKRRDWHAHGEERGRKKR